MIGRDLPQVLPPNFTIAFKRSYLGPHRGDSGHLFVCWLRGITRVNQRSARAFSNRVASATPRRTKAARRSSTRRRKDCPVVYIAGCCSRKLSRTVQMRRPTAKSHQKVLSSGKCVSQASAAATRNGKCSGFGDTSSRLSVTRATNGHGAPTASFSRTGRSGLKRSMPLGSK
jgi:hypothetical protein